MSSTESEITPENSGIPAKGSGLLDIVQSGFPISASPYSILGEAVGMTDIEAYEELSRLEKNGTIRRIGASFSSGKLGYRSALCAFSVDDSSMEEVVAAVNSLPNVTHDYSRANEFNLWFTLIAESDEALQGIFEGLSSLEGVKDSMLLPATKMFKINVDFSTIGTGGGDRPFESRSSLKRVLDGDTHPFKPDSQLDVALVRCLQDDLLPLGLDPFEMAAERISGETGLDVSENRITDRINQFKANGTIRRFGAMVRHQRLGFDSNIMTVWNVEEPYIDDVGKAFAAHAEVSHCYERPANDRWPFNLYAMVHGRNETQTTGILESLSADADRITAGHVEYEALATLREYKKTSMRYFVN